MSTLTVRTGPEDEAYLHALQRVWGADSRSETVRKAIEFAATHVKAGRKSKLEIVEDAGFVGCFSDDSRKSPEKRVKESLKKKYKR